MGFPRQKYRTAKKGEATCTTCKYEGDRNWWAKHRLRCTFGRRGSYACGKTKTCNYHTPTKEAE